MNVAIILSLRGLPLMAKEGLSLLFYLGFALLIFLIPTALVSAELATGWPEEGGVFRWVGRAFGEEAGFLAIWLQWFQNLFWYPAVLAFAAGALAYLFGTPELVNSPLYTIAVILVIYWGATLINLRGIQASSRLTTIGVVAGSIFPALFIMLLGLVWWGSGRPLEFDVSGSALIPDFTHFGNISLLAGIVLLFSGMEVNAVHSNEVENPRKTYSKAIFFSAILIFVLFFLGSLSIAAVLPEEKINLTAGVMQAFAELLNLYNIGWLLPVMGLLITFGAIGGIAAWIVGPSRGLFATAKYGLLPPLLSKQNKAGVQVHILVIQGIFISLVSLLFFVTPTVGSAFFLLSDLTIILYLIMYLLLFASAIRLRYTSPKRPRPYKIPGGNAGMWTVSGIGMLGAVFAIFVGFFPPDQLTFGSPTFYVGFLAVGIVVALGLPLWIYRSRKPSWVKKARLKRQTGKR